jgi:hypothetical protein
MLMKWRSLCDCLGGVADLLSDVSFGHPTVALLLNLARQAVLPQSERSRFMGTKYLRQGKAELSP